MWLDHNLVTSACSLLRRSEIELAKLWSQIKVEGMGWYVHILIKHTSHYLQNFPRGLGCYSQQSLEFFMGFQKLLAQAAIQRRINLLTLDDEHNENFIEFTQIQPPNGFPPKNQHNAKFSYLQSNCAPQKGDIRGNNIDSLLTPTETSVPKAVEMRSGDKHKLVKLLTIPFLNLSREELYFIFFIFIFISIFIFGKVDIIGNVSLLTSLPSPTLPSKLLENVS